MKTAEELIRNINFPLLREQKRELLEIAEDYDKDVSGIIHLIDAIQDFACDDLKIDEKLIF
jgi:hypothetical protein